MPGAAQTAIRALRGAPVLSCGLCVQTARSLCEKAPPFFSLLGFLGMLSNLPAASAPSSLVAALLRLLAPIWPWMSLFQPLTVVDPLCCCPGDTTCSVPAFKAVIQSLSRVWLFATPWTVTRQAPLSMGFPRQEYRSGLPFPSPGDRPTPGIEPTFLALAGGFFTTETPGESGFQDGLLLFHPSPQDLKVFRFRALVRMSEPGSSDMFEVLNEQFF